MESHERLPGTNCVNFKENSQWCKTTTLTKRTDLSVRASLEFGASQEDAVRPSKASVNRRRYASMMLLRVLYCVFLTCANFRVCMGSHVVAGNEPTHTKSQSGDIITKPSETRCTLTALTSINKPAFEGRVLRLLDLRQIPCLHG